MAEEPYIKESMHSAVKEATTRGARRMRDVWSLQVYLIRLIEWRRIPQVMKDVGLHPMVMLLIHLLSFFSPMLQSC